MREKIGIRTLPYICTHQWTSEVPGVRVEDKSGSKDAGSRLDDLSLPQLQMSEAKEQRPMRTGRYISFILLGSSFPSHSCPTRHRILEAGLVLGSGLLGSSSGSQEPPPQSGAPAPDVAGRAGVRFLRSLPSAVLAAPEIKIKCGLGREHGVG